MAPRVNALMRLKLSLATWDMVLGVTMRLAFPAAPLYVAVIETEVEKITPLVVTLKVAVVNPVGTVTFAGTVATFVLALDKATTAPPEGAGELRVTVPVEFPRPVTVPGFRLKPGGNGTAFLNPIAKAAQAVEDAELAVALYVPIRATG